MGRAGTELPIFDLRNNTSSLPHAHSVLLWVTCGWRPNGYDVLEANCNRCRRVSAVPPIASAAGRNAHMEARDRALLRATKRAITTGASAHILNFTYARPDPEPRQKRHDNATSIPAAFPHPQTAPTCRKHRLAALQLESLSVEKEAAVMRLHTYRDASHSRHFDLTGGGDHPWTIDLVAIAAAATLVVGFAGALLAYCIR